MTEIPEIISLATSAVSLFGTAYVAIYKLAKMEVKIETLWEFLLRRGTVDALNREVVTKNSPLRPTTEAIDSFKKCGLDKKIRNFYERKGYRLNKANLAFEIEKRFGDVISENVCKDLGLNEGACLVLAIEIAKGQN